MYEILNRIDSPADLKTLSSKELVQLCQEARNYIIEVVPQIGGHFASSLGVTELTVALNYVYNPPEDKLVWDVGHQGYVHKILTGRRDALKTIRRYGGISGFLKRSESEYDVFGAGHASTSISAGLGFAVARDILGQHHHVVSIIGDGAMTGGLAYEALNNAGHKHRNFLVILNDNGMSISPNVGAISKTLSHIVTNPLYNRLREDLWKVGGLVSKSKVQSWMSNLEESLKNLISPGVMFEELGFRYIGPIDGHDVVDLVEILQNIRDNMHGPILLHVLTRKGRGLKPAEDDPVKYHAVKPSAPKKAGADVPRYSNVFADIMLRFAKADPQIAVITAAMTEGTGLVKFREELPDQFFDVGIAEGHGVTFAAGLAAGGLKPVAAIYSTFLQRAYDHAIHDVALQKLPVIFAMDRGGLAGEDGPTHHGCYDLSYFNCIPNMIISAPKDGDELRDLIWTGLQEGKPFAVRYPKESAIAYHPDNPPKKIAVGSWEELRSGDDAVLLAVGSMVWRAEEAAEKLAQNGYQVGVVNCRFVKPMDIGMLDRILTHHQVIVTLEEGSLIGGFGSAVAQHMTDLQIQTAVLYQLGLPDRYIEHGTRQELLHDLGLSPEKIAEFVDQKLQNRLKPTGMMA
ncbi:MAG: 1-deoxy-D-xylulose-5-phosphate synthase [Gemmatimonadetes bacterium]|nr:MAG: 1-deoxy-D-xylulose-5-phosphate synthase [Gemmatimonadota bacterium]